MLGTITPGGKQTSPLQNTAHARFYLNGHASGFHPQTPKLEHFYSVVNIAHGKALLRRFQRVVLLKEFTHSFTHDHEVI